MSPLCPGCSEPIEAEGYQEPCGDWCSKDRHLCVTWCSEECVELPAERGDAVRAFMELWGEWR